MLEFSSTVLPALSPYHSISVPFRLRTSVTNGPLATFQSHRKSALITIIDNRHIWIKVSKVTVDVYSALS